MTTNEFGQAAYRYGMWDRLAKISNVVCADGKRRMFTVTSEPDTFFSQPGYVRVNGKAVTGFVACGDDRGYEFTANSYGKNGALLAS